MQELKQTLTSWRVQLHFVKQIVNTVERFKKVIIMQARPFLKHNGKRLARTPTNDAAKLPYNASSIHRRNPNDDIDAQTIKREVK